MVKKSVSKLKLLRCTGHGVKHSLQRAAKTDSTEEGENAEIYDKGNYEIVCAWFWCDEIWDKYKMQGVLQKTSYFVLVALQSPVVN